MTWPPRTKRWRHIAPKRAFPISALALTLLALLVGALHFQALRALVRRAVRPAPAVHAFYNLFWSEAAPAIAEEQLSLLSRSGVRIERLHVYGIGEDLRQLPQIEQWAAFPVQYDQLAPAGTESITLKGLHEFCKAQTAAGKRAIVLYLHPKGSFHARGTNLLYRKAMNHFVLRDPFPCLQALQSGRCDVCGMRYSREPHSHFPGNMWWADCAYVARLYAPDAPRRELAGVDLPESCVGVNRFAHEHWIGSHPLLRPCDCLPFSPDRFYWYGEERIENAIAFIDTEVRCEPAPRPGLEQYLRNQSLYHELVAECVRRSSEADRAAYASDLH